MLAPGIDTNWRGHYDGAVPPHYDQPAARLLAQLERCKSLRGGLHHDPALCQLWKSLSRWQARRLAQTHRDLLDDPRYKPAAEFFLGDLYGPKDLGERERDLERIFPVMKRVLPAQALGTLATALEMNALTQALDMVLARRLMRDFGKECEISEDLYVAAFRGCDNLEQRQYQIGLIKHLGGELARFVSRRLIHTALLVARGPALATGLGGLQQFLERGFYAFRHMGRPAEFVQTIVSRENEILRRIYAGHPEPFAL